MRDEDYCSVYGGAAHCTEVRAHTVFATRGVVASSSLGSSLCLTSLHLFFLFLGSNLGEELHLTQQGREKKGEGKTHQEKNAPTSEYESQETQTRKLKPSRLLEGLELGRQESPYRCYWTSSKVLSPEDALRLVSFPREGWRG